MMMNQNGQVSPGEDGHNGCDPHASLPLGRCWIQMATIVRGDPIRKEPGSVNGKDIAGMCYLGGIAGKIATIFSIR